MKESTYHGYPLIHCEFPQGMALVLKNRASEIQVAEFSGLGTSIVVEGIDSGRIPKVMGRFIDKTGEIHGYWWLMVPDGGQQHIIVPPEKLLIGP